MTMRFGIQEHCVKKTRKTDSAKNYTTGEKVAIGICIICTLYGLSFGILNLTEKSTVFAIINFIMAIILTSLGIWIYIKQGTKIPQFIMISISSVFFLYLFFTGGHNNFGFLWVFLVPATAFFFLGNAPGVLYSAGYLVSIILLYFFGHLLSSDFHGIPGDVFIRFIGVYSIIGLTTFIYEKSRYDNEKKIADEINKRAEAEDKLNDILNNIEDVIWSVSWPDYEKVLFISASAKELYGISPEQFYENPSLWSECIHPDDRLQSKEKIEILQKKSNSQSEYRIIRSDESEIWVLDRRHLQFNAEGKPFRLDGIVSNITKRKLAEKKLACTLNETEKMIRMMTGRENRILELKRRINGLLKESDRNAEFMSVENDDSVIFANTEGGNDE